jgi:hypothetical protein
VNSGALINLDECKISFQGYQTPAGFKRLKKEYHF